MPSIRSYLLLSVTLAGLLMTACPGGGLFPKPKTSTAASSAPTDTTTAPSAAPSAETAPTGSLKSDFVLANKAATSWAADAKLYEIEGQNIDDTGSRDATVLTDAWVYRFAADSRSGQLLAVAISGDSKVVSQLMSGSAPFPPYKYSAIGLDSPAAFRKAGVSGKDVRVNVYYDNRYGMPVYLFPEKDRLRLDAWTGDTLQ